MTTARLRLLALACLLLSAPLLWADELILRSGKIIHGRITSEDEDSYRIKVNANMAMRISKSDVARVTRDAPPEEAKSARAAARKAEAARPAPPPAATPVPVKKPVPPPPAPVVTSDEAAGEDESSQPVTISADLPAVTRTVGIVTLSHSSLKAFYPVKGATYDAAMKTITDLNHGKGFIVRGARRPSRTQWRLTWYGKPANGGTSWESLVVNSTITATLPAWKTRKSPSGAEAARWDAMMKESEDIESGHARIIEEALTSFATEVSNLTAPNEEELRSQTGKLLADARARSDKRRKGYDRRRAEIKMKRPIHRKVHH